MEGAEGVEIIGIERKREEKGNIIAGCNEGNGGGKKPKWDSLQQSVKAFL